MSRKILLRFRRSAVPFWTLPALGVREVYYLHLVQMLLPVPRQLILHVRLGIVPPSQIGDLSPSLLADLPTENHGVERSVGPIGIHRVGEDLITLEPSHPAAVLGHAIHSIHFLRGWAPQGTSGIEVIPLPMVVVQRSCDSVVGLQYLAAHQIVNVPRRQRIGIQQQDAVVLG